MDRRTEKLEQVLQKMTALAERQKAVKVPVIAGAAGTETLADDAANLQAQAAQRIAAQEELVRPVLALFGINYDSLIGMTTADGKPSVYAQAVQARPELLQALLKSDTPVLHALQVVMGYQQYAQFSEKYGSTPEAIKVALKAEALAEAGMPAEGRPPVKEAPAGDSGMALFGTVAGRRPDVKKRRGGGLQDVFGR